MKVSVSCTYGNLADLIDELNKLGVKQSDYKYLTFERDYSGCYYESDPPGILIEGTIPDEKPKRKRKD